MSKKYANIQLTVRSESLLTLGNTANYGKTANWNNSTEGNLTSISGINNGDPSYYGLYDTFGQLYEWTDTSDIEHPQLKIIRGGSYLDTNIESLKSIKKFLFNEMLSEGCFGCRIASSGNPNNLSNFVEVSGNISDSNNDINLYDNCNIVDTNTEVDPKTLKNIGIVPYLFKISQYPLSNQEYCDYLNSVDPSGQNRDIFDHRMEYHYIGGIRIKKPYENPSDGSYYQTKTNMHNKPVSFISWEKAARYCNWLHNGSQNDVNTTLYGAYNMHPIEYVDLVTSAPLTTYNRYILLTGAVGSNTSIFIDGEELRLHQRILIKNDNSNYNGIYTVEINSDAINSSYYPYYLKRDTSYTLGGQVVKAKGGHTNKNKLFQVGESCKTIAYYTVPYAPRNTIAMTTVDIYTDKVFTRAPNAKYFLPNNNEWHKASLYDKDLDKYWQYGTRSDDPPLSIVANNNGDAEYPLGFFETSEKTFPIIITKDQTQQEINENIITLGLSSNIAYSSTPADFQNYIYFVDVDITGVKAGKTYKYTFNAGNDTNWPVHITPLSGSFIPEKNGIYKLNNVLKFCPISRLSSDDIVCDSNLTFNLQNVDPVLSTQERGSGMLDLYITVSGDNKVIQNNVAINSTNLPIIPPTDIVSVKILTPDVTPNSIVVSDNQCDQYIPIVAIASTGNEHTKLNQKYKYIFSTNNHNVSIEPESGIFYLSDPYTKISSVLKLNNEKNCNLSLTCYTDENIINPSYDAVSVLCIDSCDLPDVQLYPPTYRFNDIYFPPPPPPPPPTISRRLPNLTSFTVQTTLQPRMVRLEWTIDPLTYYNFSGFAVYYNVSGPFGSKDFGNDSYSLYSNSTSPTMWAHTAPYTYLTYVTLPSDRVFEGEAISIGAGSFARFKIETMGKGSFTDATDISNTITLNG